ncbi:hypothetical protein CEXT_517021 [Caerostris extrusa]|uniref:Uncharacterized protein n=1 Tax=Caerostris extrusa TaxID=172846 RepID=A0AAV4XYZ7_CAEEX|nr:hypothetical protein CEXT_517021 [Caerostris extrusa]
MKNGEYTVVPNVYLNVDFAQQNKSPVTQTIRCIQQKYNGVETHVPYRASQYLRFSTIQPIRGEPPIKSSGKMQFLLLRKTYNTAAAENIIYGTTLKATVLLYLKAYSAYQATNIILT